MSDKKRKTGWEALTVGPATAVGELNALEKIDEDKKVKDSRMAKARAFERTFGTTQGREVLGHLRVMAFGRPRYELDHPNCEIIAAVRGGYQQMVEFIEGQIELSKVGEKT